MDKTTSSTTPATPGATKPRFPGFDVVEQADKWDVVTTGIVLGRLAPVQPLSFFAPEEEPTARALVDRLLGQDTEPRVPVLEEIDQRLCEGRGDGYRYCDMPEDDVAWRVSLYSLDAESRAAHGRPFADIEPDEQSRIIEGVRECEGDWHGLPGGRVFSLWTQYACAAFYAHPWAWNEIGFGGPAYPRGYKNIGTDRREPWEVADAEGRQP